MLDEPIHIVPYDTDWEEEFTRERERLSRALAVPADCIAHIGSTAVPTLAAKPIIDIMIGAGQLPPSAHLTVTLEGLGYESMGEAGVPGRWYFRLRSATPANVHVVLHGADHWQRNLRLRDYLRQSSSARQRYEAVKLAAVAEGATTLLAYSAAKSDVVAVLLAEAGID